MKRSYFIVGIKGAAMCHIAVILKKMGNEVRGCDVADVYITDRVLENNNISISTGFDPALLPAECDVVVYSAAHSGRQNAIVQAALSRGVNVMSQAALLGELMRGFARSIAVCGTHGKTTSTSLMIYSLIKLGVQPSYMVGTSTFGDATHVYDGGDYQSQDTFVIEADEYVIDAQDDRRAKFLEFNPTLTMCTNVDFDHPDVYADQHDVDAAFAQFFAQSGKLVYCGDDPGAARLASAHAGSLSYGVRPHNAYRIHSVTSEGDRHSYSLTTPEGEIEDITIKLYGPANVLNSAGVMTCLLTLGYNAGDIKRAFATFTGPKRRFELIYENNEITLIDDYAHHPVEIAAVIAAARERYPVRRIIVIFQPHTASRTSALVDEFGRSLAAADYGYILPIFRSAREAQDSDTISSSDIAHRAGDHVESIEKVDLISSLAKLIHAGDVIMTIGAGDVYKCGVDIIKLIDEYTR